MLGKLRRWATGDVSVLVLSSMVAQALNVLVYPLLTRAYTLADFGVFSAIIAMAAFVGAVIMLRLDAVYQIAARDEEADILIASMTIATVITVLCFVAALAFGSLVYDLFGKGTKTQSWHWSYAGMVALSALLTGVFALARQHAARHGKYRRFAVAQFLRTLVAVAAQLALAFLIPGPFGLLAGFSLGFVVATALIWPVGPDLAEVMLRTPRLALARTRAILRRYRAFISVDVVNVLISAAVLLAYPVFVLTIFGAEQAGLFAVASRLTFIPIDVLGAAISTVYFQKFAQATRDGTGGMRLYTLTIAGAAGLALAITVVYAVVAKPLVVLVFKPEWERMGVIILYLLPTFVARFIISCVGSTPLALSQPKIVFVWNLVQISTIALALVVSIGQELETFLLYSGVALLAVSAIYALVLVSIIAKRFGPTAGT